MEWLALSRRSLAASHAATSVLNSAPASSQRGRRDGEVVLDDPLHEGFGHHGGLVPEAQFAFDGVKVAGRGGRHHPVHHGVRERDVRVQPGQQRLCLGSGQCGGKGAHQVAGQLPVAGKVVARDHGEGPGVGTGALLEPAGDLSDGRLRRLPGEVGPDLFVGGVERSGAADRSGSPSP